MNYTTQALKYLLTLCLVFLSTVANAHREFAQGIHPIDWHTDKIEHVVSGSGTTEHGGKTEFVEGKHCITGNSLYFDVLDDYAFDIDETVELEVEFDLKATASTVQLAYDANAPKNVTDASFAVHGYTQKVKLPNFSKDKRWHRERFILDRARFSGLGLFIKHDFFLGVVGSGSVRICNITLTRSYTTTEPERYGRLSLTVRGENNRQVPVRVGLYDKTGRMPLPSEDAITIKEWQELRQIAGLMPIYGGAWPAENRRIFYIDGDYRAKIPVGNYDLVISRGMEYRFSRRTVTIEAGKDNLVDIKLERWSDMPAKDWYSGDTHLHYGRGHIKDDINIFKHAMAEDLHVTNLLEMGTNVDTYARQYNWGENAWYGKGTHYLVPGQEDPRTNRVGHTVSLNLSEPVRFPDKYFLYHNVFEKVKAQGGVTGYAHSHDGLLPFFNAGGGLALDVPFGLVDLVELFNSPRERKSPWVSSVWFDFLNLGYKLAPMAGTDYMNIGVQPGTVRTYVKLEEGYSVQSWFDALKAGRSFVTSGPMLEMTVNGKGPGSELKLKVGDTVIIKASADVMPDIGTLSKLELYEQGKLIATKDSAIGSETLHLDHEIKVGHGTWFVLLAYGKNGGLDTLHAATAPTYVSVNANGFCKLSDVAGIALKMKNAMNSMLDGRYNEFVSWSTKEIDAPQKILLQARIHKASKIYDGLVSQAKIGVCGAGFFGN